MASAKSLSLLRASLIFFLASLMLGSAAMYIQFGIVIVMVAWCYRWEGLKETIPEIIKGSKPVWLTFLLFTILFALTLGLSSTVSMSEISELKWLSFPLIFALALHPLLIGRELGKIEKFAILFLLGLSLFSLTDSLYQVINGRNLGRQLLFEKDTETLWRGAGLLRNPIPFAHVTGSLFFMSIVGAIVLHSAGKKKKATVTAVISLVFFLCVLSSFARGAWLAIALTAICSLVIMPKALRKINLIGLGTASIIGAGTLAMNGALFQRFLSAFDPDTTANATRLHLWKCNFDLLVDHPFGLGFNANDSLLPGKLAEFGYPALSFQTHPHNEYIDYAVATGFPGLLLYLGITIWLLVFTVKMLRQANLKNSTPEIFLLTASALLQSFLNGCALTDQFTTPGRFLICLAWAVPIAIAAKNRGELPTTSQVS